MEIIYYEPNSITILVCLLGIYFIVFWALCLGLLKFDVIGKILMGISMLLYLYVGYYTVASGYYADSRSLDIFAPIGYLELIILAYPYIFLTLACKFSKRKNLI